MMMSEIGNEKRDRVWNRNTDSTCYAEYMALHDATHKALFLCQLLTGLHLLPSSPSCLLCDNDMATCLAEDHIWHLHTKHICIKYHFIHKQVLAGDVTISHIPSKDNTADIFMKPLGKVNFQHLRQYLSLDTRSQWGGAFNIFQHIHHLLPLLALYTFTFRHPHFYHSSLLHPHHCLTFT